jgi:hypothetical protein
MHPAELQVERTGRQRRAILKHRVGSPFTNTLDMVSDLLFDFDIARTEFSDAAYAAIGRALTFATRFEANCRALAAVIGVREAMKARGAPDGESVDDLFERLTQEYWHVRRLRHHETAVALYEKLPQDLRAILRDGRQARNQIAHELTLSIAAEIQTEEGRSTLLESLRSTVAKIADADRIVCVLAHLETRETLPTVAAFEEFPKRVIEWVCDVD